MRILLLIVVLLLAACSGSKEPEVTSSKRFERLSSKVTGIDFSNTLSIADDFDVFRYRNYYNGAGVGIGDVNNDGLADIYLTSNMGDNKLYINKGNMVFEDVTEKAGVKGSKIWSTGVSLADVNADGFLDIYVCNSGDVNGGKRENELFINNGNQTFTERAAEYGLADKGFSTHAVFFDYDLDGDLDCYVLNNSFQPPNSLGLSNRRHERDALGGDKLFKNEKGKFVDVTDKAGIFSSLIGFGLGVTAGDVNQDGWPDLYVSNDFFERDYLYINNHDGTFTDRIEGSIGHLSMFSMGADIADLNNDHFPEIFSTDMLPNDDYRLKTLVAFETFDTYQLRVKNDYYHQYMRNMLHKNNADGTFSEIGRFAGVEATDWSWGSLIADFDNDGYKDIFVSNGIYKDVTNQDFVEFLGSEQIHAAMEGKKIDYAAFLEKMPSQKISNFMFTRIGEWRYENVSKAWGLDEPSFSNGAAYGDLDNDGDLDLVVNNINQELFVYKNRSTDTDGSRTLSISFKGAGGNTFGVGASVVVQVKDQSIMQEHFPIRGYQSSMDYKMVIGIGANASADSVTVRWPDGKVQTFADVSAGTALVVDYRDAVRETGEDQEHKPSFLVSAETEIVHRENDFDDFDQDRLAYHMLSTQGPAFAKADLNHDGLDDFYLGGSVGNPGKLYLQQQSGEFNAIPLEHQQILADETGAVFFDADGDKDEDLYIVTGGTELTPPAIGLRDLFYENVGEQKGVPQFRLQPLRIPSLTQSGSCVRPADFDGDGDVDLFVGTRVIAGAYGKPCDQYLLENDGKGTFKEVSGVRAPALKGLGMVADALWYDHDRNGFLDLIIVGEWMPIKVFLNDGKALKPIESKGLEKSSGWWNNIVAADVDRDGDLDFVLGNVGRNSKFKTDSTGNIKLYMSDFDKNGSSDPVFSYTSQGVDYPLNVRNDILSQMISYRKEFVYYKDYAGKSIDDIFGSRLRDASVFALQTQETSLLINHERNGFELRPLPIEAQFAPVYASLFEDVNRDGVDDLILGGNLYAVKPEAGRYDAMHGLVLVGDGKGNFNTVSSLQSGVKVQGEVRHIVTLKSDTKSSFLFIRNNDRAIRFRRR